MQASSDSAGMQVLTMDTVEIEAMTFDLDDTLYDNLPVIKKAVATMFSELEERYPKIKVAPDDFRAEMIGRQKSLSPDGGADLGALRHRTISHFAAEAGYGNASEIADDVMQAFLRERNNVVLFPGVLETLSLLSSRGIKLGAITNGNADMSKTPLKDALEFCVSAGALGQLKPGEAPFLEALSLCSSSPARTVHVGDDLVSDVSGAHRLGIRTVWFNCKNKPLPEEHKEQVDAIITDIRQLQALVEEWSTPKT
jgi:FMN hydrolase / 5-amino-6-(5-phospho-D-ribitylamino)uracil phosphatase